MRDAPAPEPQPGAPGSGGYERIRAPSAYQLVARQIEDRILSGRLRPGDEVGTEADLARQFGVNRSTVREGIRALEQSGLVRREAGRRLCVTRPQYRSLSSRMSRAMILGEVTFDELYETASLLEIGAARAAARSARAPDIAALRANVAAAREGAADAARIAELDTAFHRLVVRAAHNRVLELAREPAAMLFFPTTEAICREVPEGTGRMLQAHDAIVDAIAAGDADEAGIWMRRHVADWLKGFRRSGRDPAAPVERELASWGAELD